MIGNLGDAVAEMVHNIAIMRRPEAGGLRGVALARTSRRVSSTSQPCLAPRANDVKRA